MAKEIKYEKSESGVLCLTKCPYDDEKQICPVHVASWSCIKCSHHVSNDKKKQIVVCNADEKTK